MGGLLHRGGRHAHTRGGIGGCRSRVERSDSSAAPGWQSQATARHGPPAAAGAGALYRASARSPPLGSAAHGTGDGAEDVADPRAVPRAHLLRARGDGGLRGARRDGLRRLLRLARRADGRGAGRGRGRHVLQLQPRRSSTTPSRRRGTPTTPAALLEARLDARRRRPAPRRSASLLDDPGVAARRRAGPRRRRGVHRRRASALRRPRRLPWPDAPHLALWHAITLLREFRGDGHIACLVDAGPRRHRRARRPRRVRRGAPRRAPDARASWDDAAWDASVGSLGARGLVDGDGAFTEAGRRAAPAHRGPHRRAGPGALGGAGGGRLRRAA